MKIVVNDANILIDFCKLDLLAEFFHLAFDFQVVDAVWEELRQHQASLQPYVKTGRLAIVREAADLREIFEIRHQRNQLSIPDCTALLYAKRQKSILLTSDKNLRTTAGQHKIEVRGHLWVFDNLVDTGIIAKQAAAGKLHELSNRVNPKLGLPKNELDARMKDWMP